MPKFDHNAPSRQAQLELIIRLDIVRLLRDARLPRMTVRGKEIYGLCPGPNHHDRKVGSWSMHTEPGHPLNGRSHCYSCGFDGDVLQVLAHLRRVDDVVAFDLAKRYTTEVAEPASSVAPAIPPSGWYAIEPVDWPEAFAIMPGSDCFNYLRSRSIGRADIEREGLQDWRAAQRVLVPVRLFGQMVSYDARLYGADRRPDIPEETRHHKVITPSRGKGGNNGRFALLGLDAADRRDGRLTLVEGWASRIRAIQAGLPNVVALRTASLTQQKAALLGWASYVLALCEPDQGGRLMNEQVRGWMANDEREIRCIICDDEMDPADYSVTGLRKLLERNHAGEWCQP